jgi:predicted transcriptional regulator
MIYHPSKCHDLPVKQAQIEPKKAKEELALFYIDRSGNYGCLSVDDYVKIANLPVDKVQKEIEILCEVGLLKPVKSKIYDITKFGRLALSALGVTDELVRKYKKLHAM